MGLQTLKTALCCFTKQTLIQVHLEDYFHFSLLILKTFFFYFLTWFFFYPFTTQQDKALERHPLDRVTQFLQMETPMPKNWNCLVQRDEQKHCAEQKNVSIIQRLGCSDTLHMTVVHFTWHPEEKHPLSCQSNLVVTVWLLFYQPNYYFRFLSFSECCVLWPLFPPPPTPLPNSE